jgi:hypothetical protein
MGSDIWDRLDRPPLAAPLTVHELGSRQLRLHGLDQLGVAAHLPVDVADDAAELIAQRLQAAPRAPEMASVRIGHPWQ